MFTLSRIKSFVFSVLALGAAFPLSAAESDTGAKAGVLSDFAPLVSVAGKANADAVGYRKTLGAEAALFSGLPLLAAELAQRELSDKTLSNAERDRILLTLSGAQIALGDYAEASASLDGVTGNSPQKRLRAALIALGQNRASDVPVLLEGLTADALPPQERAWFFLARSLSEIFLGKHIDATADFAEAEKNALRAIDREHLAFVREWAELMTGQGVPAAELNKLREVRDTLRGTPNFAPAAKLYVLALSKSGKRAEALAALRESVPVPEAEKADFALLEGLLTEDTSSEAARSAFLRVIEARPPRTRQSPAFFGLLRNVLALSEKKEEAIIAANGIEEFLNALPPDERVRDLELFTRASIAFNVGDYRRAEKLAEELNSLFPASPFVPDALRLLVGIAVREKEFRRAVPLLERLRSTDLSLDETVRTDILIADCNFLSGDYALAAAAYARVSDAGTLSGDDLGVIFTQQAFSNVRNGNVLAAAALLDSPIAERVPAEWRMRAECLVIEALQQERLWFEASERAKKFLAQKDLPTDFRLRILWVQALLALDLDDSETALKAADALAEIAAHPERIVSEELRRTAPELVSRTDLLKARALFLSGKDEEALSLLADLRERYPDSASAVISWLEEARRFNDLGKPARALVCYETLLDRYGSQEKFAEYAAIAAFEAAQAAATIGRPEEAVKQMQTLISRYPKSPLVFYARMRQADFFRILNDFDSALAVYDNLIAVEPERPAMRVVEMRRADTLRAIAARAETDENARGTFEDARTKAEAAYERLFSLPDQPLSLKAEAGYKWGYAVEHSVPATDEASSARSRATSQAQEIFWKTVTDVLASAQARGEKTLDGTSGYWVARCLFALAESYEKDGDYESARGVYRKILDWSAAGLIPGKSYAEPRLNRILEK